VRNGCGSKPPGPSRILGFRNQPGTPARFILRRGISDTYALGVLAETTGLDVPISPSPRTYTGTCSKATNGQPRSCPAPTRAEPIPPAKPR